jgi:hypothetical protein
MLNPKTSIFHCERCGNVVYEDVPFGSPQCCGGSMIKAVADFTWSLDDTGLHKVTHPTPDIVAAINDEHRELLRRLATERDVWNRMECPTATNCDEILGRLGALRDDLAQHFDEEERGGYLAHVLDASPCLLSQVEKLRRQHADFLARLDEMRDALNSQHPGRWQDARANFGRLVVEMRGHEAAETALARFAFSDEVMTIDESSVRGG